MSKTSYLKYIRLARFSGPASERILYRQMAKRKPTRILEIGLGLGVRSLRMFDVARRYCETDAIQYTGIDLFEARQKDLATLSMKDAYRLLRQQGVRVKLVPGDALAAMTVTANSLADTELIIVDSDISDEDLTDAWKYFPRMMNENTLLFRQTVSGQAKVFETLSRDDIKRKLKSADDDVARAA